MQIGTVFGEMCAHNDLAMLISPGYPLYYVILVGRMCDATGHIALSFRRTMTDAFTWRSTPRTQARVHFNSSSLYSTAAVVDSPRGI